MSKVRICRKACFYAIEVTAGILAALVLLLSFVGWQIYNGTFSTSYFNDYVGEIFIGQNSPYKVRIGDSQLYWDHQRGAVMLTVQNLGVHFPEKENLFELENVEVQFSRQALLSLSLAPKTLKFENSTLYMDRVNRKRLRFVQEEQTVSFSPDVIASLIVTPVYFLKQSKSLDAFESLSVQNLKVLRLDETGQHVPLVRQSDIIFYKSDSVLNGQFAADISVDQAVTNLDGEIIYDLNSDKFEVRTAFNDLSTEQLAKFQDGLVDHLPIEANFSGSLSTYLKITAQEDGTPTVDLDLVGLALVAKEGKINLAPYADEMLPFTDLKITAVSAKNLEYVQLREFTADLGALKITASGGAKLNEETQAHDIQVKVDIAEADAKKILAAWPPALATEARNWPAEHVKKGIIQASAAVGGRYIGESFELIDVKGSGTFKGASSTYFRTFPAVTDANGRLEFDMESANVYMDSGFVEDVAVSEGHVKLYDFDQDPAVADISFKAEGPIPSVLDILDRDPIYVSKQFPFPVEALSGTAVGTVQFFELPLLDIVMADEDFKLKVDGLLKDVDAQSFVGDRDLANGQFFINLDQSKISIRGPTQLDGVQINAEYAQTFSEDTILYTVSGHLTEAERKMIKVMDDDFFKGPLALDVKITDFSGKRYDIDANLDFTETSVIENFSNWTKPAGIPGTLAVKAKYNPEKSIELTQFNLKSKDLDVALLGFFDADFNPKDVVISKAEVGLTKLAGKLKEEEGMRKFSIQGEYLDATNFSQIPSSDATENSYLESHFDQVSFGGIETLNNAALIFDKDGQTGAYKSLNLIAYTGNQVPISARIYDDQGLRLFKVMADDAGSTLRGLDVYDNVQGGILDVTGAFDDTGEHSILEGTITIDDFRVTNAPAIAQILSVVLLTGVPDLLQGEGVKFEKLIGTFSYSDDLLTVKDLRASGNSVGVRATGVVDSRNDVIDMKGSVAPAYTLNKLLGEIPLIGSILTAGGTEQLLAANYSIKGSVEGPNVTVNPLTALTPGILRKLFSSETKYERPPEETEETEDKNIEADDVPPANKPAATDVLPQTN